MTTQNRNNPKRYYFRPFGKYIGGGKREVYRDLKQLMYCSTLVNIGFVSSSIHARQTTRPKENSKLFCKDIKCSKFIPQRGLYPSLLRTRFSSCKPFKTVLEAKLRVAVVGGGPGGSSAAEALSKAGIETFIFERKWDNAKPCGGAIPLCMIEEFGLPLDIVDRKVRRMKMISPSNREVDVGKTLKPHEYIGMTRREVLDSFLRERAIKYGAQPIHGLVTDIVLPKTDQEPYLICYSDFTEKGNGVGKPNTLQVDMIIGADGANSRVAKVIDAGDYNYAIAFQERIRLPPEKMSYYEELAEMYVGDDVSPDFYAWVFPKYDHVGVGTGTVLDRPSIKKYQAAIRTRAASKLNGGHIIKVEAHPIPEHPRPRRVVGRVALVGDAAGYVTKCSGEGIYFAAKSGRMCAEAIAEISLQGERIPSESELKETYLKRWDKKYWSTYKVLDILQAIFYRNNIAREAFVELCEDEYVQQMTFDSYLYKTVAKGNPLQDVRLLFHTLGAFARAPALAP